VNLRAGQRVWLIILDNNKNKNLTKVWMMKFKKTIQSIGKIKISLEGKVLQIRQILEEQDQFQDIQFTLMIITLDHKW